MAALAGAALLAAALVLYVCTLDNGLRLDELKGGDLITHHYAQLQARPSNAPGYPLYTMGGWLWFRLGRALLGSLLSPIEILSLYSTLWALAALGCLYWLLLRFTEGSVALSLSASAFYGVTYFFWYYAVSTEQYASAVFQTLLVVALALRWEETGRARYIYLLALVLGTCAANLVTTLLVTPPLVYFVLSRRPLSPWRRSQVLHMAGLFCLPLLSYGFVYVRGAQHPEWRGEGVWPNALAWFLDFLSTRQGREEMTLQLLPLDLRYLHLVPAELGWLVLFAGLVGLWFFPRHQGIFLGGTLLLYLLFSYVDRYGNWYQVVMPAYPLLVLSGARLVHVASNRLRQPWRSLPVFLVLIAVVERASLNLPRVDQRDRPDDDALCPGLALLLDSESLVGGNLRVAVTYDEQLSLEYLRNAFGLGLQLVPVPPSLADESVCAFSRQAFPLLPPGLLGHGIEMAGEELFLRCGGEPATRPQGGALLSFGSVRALSAELRAYPAPCGGQRLLVRLAWVVDRPPKQDFVASLRLMRSGQRLHSNGALLQSDHPPLWGVLVPSRWQPGQVLLDAYSIGVGSEWPQGEPDSAELVLYRNAPEGPVPLESTIIPLPTPTARPMPVL